MRRPCKLNRRVGVLLLVAVTGLLLLLVYSRYQRAQELAMFSPYPTGGTGLKYSGTYLQEFDGQEFAKFKFGNAEGVQLKLVAKVSAWDAQEQRWKEEALAIRETVPNRFQCEFYIARNGKWKVMVQAHAQPTLGEKIADGFNRGRERGGLVGAWSSPEMVGSKPAK